MKRCSLFLFFITFITFYSFSETLEFRCDRPVMVYNDHVGNEWLFDVEIEGKRCSLDETVNIEGSDIIEVVFKVEEVDKISDFGSTTLKIDLNTLDLNTEQYTDIEVIVKENRGRYSGNTAKWKMRIYYSKSTKPESLNR